jgi:NADH-quinone oxidoreductase subunit M
MAAMGLPGSVGFIAEMYTLIGSFGSFTSLAMGMTVMIFFSVSVLIGAAYAIRTMSLLFTGPAKPQMQQLEDLRAPELLAAGILVTGIVLFGLLPGPLLDLSAATISQMNGVISQRIL